jgi:hypothetical protein
MSNENENGYALKYFFTLLNGHPVRVFVESVESPMSIFDNAYTIDNVTARVVSSPDGQCSVGQLIDVSPLDLRADAASLFKSGDTVESVLNNNHNKFVVRGIEPETNRVVCRSLAQSDCDRTRWAYKPEELRLPQETYYFVIGGQYRIKGVDWLVVKNTDYSVVLFATSGREAGKKRFRVATQEICSAPEHNEDSAAIVSIEELQRCDISKDKILRIK